MNIIRTKLAWFACKVRPAGGGGSGVPTLLQGGGGGSGPPTLPQ